MLKDGIIRAELNDKTIILGKVKVIPAIQLIAVIGFAGSTLSQVFDWFGEEMMYIIFTLL